MNTVTVIIPVYNVQDYLARCIDSVVAQSHTNLEILLVDDGSTDTSGDMCDSYAQQDSRITVIHKPNGGLSDARNAGLDAMTGNYVTFIDADDYVHPKFIELLLQTITTTGAPIAVCHWQELKEGQTPKSITPSDTHINCRELSQEEALKSIFYQQELNHSACSRLFDATIFNDIRFPKGMLYEDLAIIYPIMRKISKVALITPAMYYYMHRSGSIINTMTLQRTQVLDILDSLEQEIAPQAPHLLPAVQSRHLSACFNMMRLMPLSDPQWEETLDRCWEYTKNIRNLCLKDKNVRLKNKIAVILSFLGRNFLLSLINHNHKNK